jgi:eukaryotic-like serine/threonine-protein kinase
VLDFGLVKAFGEPAGDGRQRGAPALTRENFVQGTPAFIAPEQALGEPDLDARVDIYALGCVAYWLLTGEFVFTADTTMGFLIHHIHTQPRPPSELVSTAIPPELDEMVLSCLAKDPAQRPQTPAELSRRLAEVAGAERWNVATARAWWDAHLPATPVSPA